MKHFLRLALALLVTLASSCTEERYRVPRGNQVEVTEIARYDREFFETGQIADSAFWKLYNESVMLAGPVGEASTKALMDVFRNDSDMIRVAADCETRFASSQPYAKAFSQAFTRLCAFVDDMPVPKISFHISGFGQSVVSAPDILSASVEKFLGNDYPLYGELFYPYQCQRMTPEHLVADCLNGWIRSEFTNASLMSDTRLIDYLVYEGKILFLLEKVFPGEPMDVLIGCSPEQADWLKSNEARMWQRILEYDHLYSRDPLVLSKYIGDAPTTVYFTEESPGRAAIWNGYGIVSAYMEHSPETSIMELLMETDAERIFSISLYRP